MPDKYTPRAIEIQLTVHIKDGDHLTEHRYEPIPGLIVEAVQNVVDGRQVEVKHIEGEIKKVYGPYWTNKINHTPSSEPVPMEPKAERRMRKFGEPKPKSA